VFGAGGVLSAGGGVAWLEELSLGGAVVVLLGVVVLAEDEEVSDGVVEVLVDWLALSGGVAVWLLLVSELLAGLAGSGEKSGTLSISGGVVTLKMLGKMVFRAWFWFGVVYNGADFCSKKRRICKVFCLVRFVTLTDGVAAPGTTALTIELTCAWVGAGSLCGEIDTPVLIAPRTIAIAAHPATITCLASNG